MLGVNGHHEKTSVSETAVCAFVSLKFFFQSLDINVVCHQQCHEKSREKNVVCAISSPQAIKLLFQTLSKHCKSQEGRANCRIRCLNSHCFWLHKACTHLHTHTFTHTRTFRCIHTPYRAHTTLAPPHTHTHARTCIFAFIMVVHICIHATCGYMCPCQPNATHMHTHTPCTHTHHTCTNTPPSKIII